MSEPPSPERVPTCAKLMPDRAWAQAVEAKEKDSPFFARFFWTAPTPRLPAATLGIVTVSVLVDVAG